MKIFPALILATLFCTSTSYAAGFDCNKAKNAAEKTICSTTSLSDLDEILVLSFNKATATSVDVKALKTAQLSWLKSRDLCATDVDCLTNSYTARLSELINLVANRPDTTEPPPSSTTPQPNEPATDPETTATPTGRTLVGTIASYECGDNCYLTVKDEQGKDHVALCTAPECASWNEVAEMPASFLQKKVQVSLGRAKQYDGAGNEMGEMDAFDSLTLLE